jgi:hypothetical protein
LLLRKALTVAFVAALGVLGVACTSPSSQAVHSAKLGPRYSNIGDYVSMRGDQVVVVPNGVYRGADVNVGHPATSGPLKGWLVLVAQSPHGAVVDMRSSPLHLEAGTSRVLFVGFQFVNGSMTVDGDHIWFWRTDHYFGSPNGNYLTPDGVHVYAASANDVRFYGSDIHRVCDGIDISNSHNVLLEGVHIWDTYASGSPCHNDAIDAVQGNTQNFTVRDSWIEGRIAFESRKGAMTGTVFQHTWVSGSPSAGFALTAGKAIDIVRRDVYSWGHNNGYDVHTLGSGSKVSSSGVHDSAPPRGMPSPPDQWRAANSYDGFTRVLASAP